MNFATNQIRQAEQLLRLTGPFVWFEVLSDDSLSLLLEHADRWSRIGQLIVTVDVHNIDFLKQIVDADYKLVASLKVVSAVRDPASKVQWQNVAWAARNAADICGSPVLLENETALGGFDGELPLEQNWPQEGIWWYPAVIGESWDEIERTSNHVKRAMTLLPKCRMISTSHKASPLSFTYGWSRRQRERLSGISGSLLRLMWVHDQYWSLRDALDAMQPGDILYPQISNVAMEINK
jgi:hypothetical protein